MGLCHRLRDVWVKAAALVSVWWFGVWVLVVGWVDGAAAVVALVVEPSRMVGLVFGFPALLWVWVLCRGWVSFGGEYKFGECPGCDCYGTDGVADG